MEHAELKAAIEGIQAATVASLNEQRAEWTKRYDELKAAGADSTDIKLQLERALKRLDGMEAEWTRKATDLHAEMNREKKSLGEMLTDSDAFKEFRIKGRGTTIFDVPGKSFFPDELNGVGIPAQFKTTITSAAVGNSTPGILTPDRQAGISKPGVRRIRVRELMNRLTTESNAVEWVKENAFTNAASPVAETVSKPESALTFTVDSATVKTLAHWIPAAKQILDDFAQLQGYINTRLLEGLKDVEDYELVAGDGTGQHLSGLIAESTAYDTARNVAYDTKIDKVNHYLSQIEDVLQYADGIIMHPRDWRAIQLIKEEPGATANTGAYLLGGPQGTSPYTLWGLPVATTTAMPVGKLLVGNFQQYCTVYDRMAARIDISTEHADFFIRNMVAIRAEERLTFTVTRADALVYGSF